MQTERLLRLRLAARALIEWRIPAAEDQYRQVLSELLEIHPNAKSWGLSSDDPILDIDEGNVILWFLSETLDTSIFDLEFRRFEELIRLGKLLEDETFNDIRVRMASHLCEFGIGENAEQPLWQNGPSASAIVEKIITVERFGEVDSVSLYAILATMLPANDAARNAFLAEFWEGTIAPLGDPHSQVIIPRRKPKTLVKFATVVSDALVTVLPLIFFWLIAPLIMGREKFAKFPKGLLTVLLISAFMIVKAVNFLGARLLKRIPLIWRRVNSMRAGFDTRVRQKRVNNIAPQIEHFASQHQAFLLTDVTAEISFHKFGLFKSMVLCESLACPDLKYLLLAATRWIRVDDARELLREIRKSYMRPELRRLVFGWICKAKLIELWRPEL